MKAPFLMFTLFSLNSQSPNYSEVSSTILLLLGALLKPLLALYLVMQFLYI